MADWADPWIAVSVASTVVLLRALMDHGSLDTPEGHAAVGWLIVEDIITVLVLVLLPLLRPAAVAMARVFGRRSASRC
jgi:CPA2 family monovalent cation:H+ antiporter-2